MKLMLGKKNLVRNTLITIYVLAVLGISANAKAEMEIKPIFTGYKPAISQTFVGEVAMTPDQDFYLIVSEQEVYQLAANIDLTEFNGQSVFVQAFKSKYKSSETQKVGFLDPLPESDKEALAAPVLVVIGISEAAQ
jgi:hypothetical protein